MKNVILFVAALFIGGVATYAADRYQSKIAAPTEPACICPYCSCSGPSGKECKCTPKRCAEYDCKCGKAKAPKCPNCPE